MNAPHGRRERLLAVALALAAAVGLAVAAHQGWIERLAATLSRDAISADPRTRSRFRTALRRAGSLYLQPPSDFLAEASTGPGGRCPDPLFGPRPTPASEAPSTRLAPPELTRPGRGGISLAIEPCRLRRLDEHRLERGRDWEEVGWISVFEDGTLRFATPVGVRIHGHHRRRRPEPSFRFYFRGALGESYAPAGLLRPGLAPAARRLVAKRQFRRNDGKIHQFLEPVALDIARQLGAHVPYARPFALSVNGGVPQPFVVLEYLDDGYLAERFGVERPEIARPKDVEADRPGSLDELLDWLRAQPAPLTTAVVESRFDVRQLAAAVTTAVYTNATDGFQGPMFRDPLGRVDGGRWSWVTWDLDSALRINARTWRFTSANELLSTLLTTRRAGRFPAEMLAIRLLQEDPGFRREIGRRLVAAMNYDVSPEFLDQLARRYRPMAAEMAVSAVYLERLPALLAERHAQLRRVLESELGLGPWRTLDVRAPHGALVVEGHEVATPRRFHYPAGTPLHIAVPARLRDRFAGWGGDARPDPASPLELALTIDADLAIEAVFRD